MDAPKKLAPRERLLLVVSGIVLAILGCMGFAYSKANDPDNRAAILAIAAILVGLTRAGHGLRGRKESVVQHAEPPPAGPPLSPEKTLFGVLAAWLVPGLGHWIIGRRAKAVLFFVSVTATFLAGTLLAKGRNLSIERDWVYFIAYMFNGLETAVGWLLTRSLELDQRIRYHQLGLTYTAVACLLNVVAMMDFVSTCGRATEAAEETKHGEASSRFPRSSEEGA